MGNKEFFPLKSAQTPEDYYSVVKSAVRHIDRFRYVTDDGAYWTVDPSRPLNLSRYHGDAGIVELYLELAEHDLNDEYLTTASEGVRYLASHWRDLLLPDRIAALQRQESLPQIGKSSDFGVAGIAATLVHAWYVLTSERDSIYTALREIADWYVSIAQAGEYGTYWSGNSTQLFDGGIIEILISVNEILKDASLESLLLSAGREFLSHGDRQYDGTLDFDGFKQIRRNNYWKDAYYEKLTGLAETNGFKDPKTIANYQRLIHSHRPNFAYGPAGAGYVLTRLYELSGDASYLDAAERAARFVINLRVPSGKGFLSPHDLNTGRDLYYVGECNGVAGTSRLLYALYRKTADNRYLGWIQEYVGGLESLGAPEKRSQGLWDNVCLCCGHAGLLRFFIGLYRGTNDDYWLDLARRTAKVILGVAEITEGEHGSEAVWPIAWSRLNPGDVGRPIGYKDGSAGVASALFELYLLETGRYEWRHSYDEPWPDK